jgi:hypothetical protein
MRILDWLAYLSWFLAAAACLLVLFADELAFAFLLGLAGSITVSGVLFYAFSKVIYLLTEIRDHLRPIPKSKNEGQNETTMAQLSTPSIEEISADITRLKKGIK